MLAFVGGGGKTSTIYAYASFLASQGKRVIVTTTTHMQYPCAAAGPLYTSAAEAEKRLSAVGTGAVAVCGTDDGMRGGVHRITGLPEAEFRRCRPDSKRPFCDVVLIEADGAKMLPLKAPVETEPVIPHGTDTVVVCAGLDAIGGRLADVCFRQEKTAGILMRDGMMTAEKVIGCADMAHILFRGYIEPMMTAQVPVCTCIYALLNKTDMTGGMENGRRTVQILNALVDQLHQNAEEQLRGHPVFCGTYIASIKNREYIYEEYGK